MKFIFFASSPFSNIVAFHVPWRRGRAGSCTSAATLHQEQSQWPCRPCPCLQPEGVVHGCGVQFQRRAQRFKAKALLFFLQMLAVPPASHFSSNTAPTHLCIILPVDHTHELSHCVPVIVWRPERVFHYHPSRRKDNKVGDSYAGVVGLDVCV